MRYWTVGLRRNLEELYNFWNDNFIDKDRTSSQPQKRLVKIMVRTNINKNIQIHCSHIDGIQWCDVNYEWCSIHILGQSSERLHSCFISCATITPSEQSYLCSSFKYKIQYKGPHNRIDKTRRITWITRRNICVSNKSQEDVGSSGDWIELLDFE